MSSLRGGLDQTNPSFGGAETWEPLGNSAHSTGNSRKQSGHIYFPCIGHMAFECILLHHASEILSHIRFLNTSEGECQRPSAAFISNLRTKLAKRIVCFTWNSFPTFLF